MSFGDYYGDECEGVIHVHHREPMKQSIGEYEIDPEVDLIPVCPNCHVAMHAIDTTAEDLHERIKKRDC